VRARPVTLRRPSGGRGKPRPYKPHGVLARGLRAAPCCRAHKKASQANKRRRH
jgi:hypothetical protein